MINLNASVNFYMFHGGTNFGFSNGADPAINKDDPLKNFEWEHFKNLI